jgi:hypothetical protein
MIENENIAFVVNNKPLVYYMGIVNIAVLKQYLLIFTQHMAFLTALYENLSQDNNGRY